MCLAAIRSSICRPEQEEPPKRRNGSEEDHHQPPSPLVFVDRTIGDTFSRLISAEIARVIKRGGDGGGSPQSPNVMEEEEGDDSARR